LKLIILLFFIYLIYFVNIQSSEGLETLFTISCIPYSKSINIKPLKIFSDLSKINLIKTELGPSGEEEFME
jgi:hypothetical protein